MRVQRPLIWSDELASMLFLWLAMLGSVIAFRRNAHMRMTALVAKLSPQRRAFLDVFATGAALAFLLMVVWPAYEYAQEEAFITTPALEISNSWRAAALPFGISLMAVFALLRLLQEAPLRTVLAALGTLAVVLAAFWFAGPLFRQLGNLNLVIFLSASSRCRCSPACRSRSPSVLRCSVISL